MNRRGSAAGESIDGLGGDDHLYGLGGNDRPAGGEGADRLDGGEGADRMEGGTGNDTYFVDNAGDVVIATVGWRHRPRPVVGRLHARRRGRDLLLTGTAAAGRGNVAPNVITGNAKANTLAGATATTRCGAPRATTCWTAGRGRSAQRWPGRRPLSRRSGA